MNEAAPSLVEFFVVYLFFVFFFAVSISVIWNGIFGCQGGIIGTILRLSLRPKRKSDLLHTVVLIRQKGFWLFWYQEERETSPVCPHKEDSLWSIYYIPTDSHKRHKIMNFIKLFLVISLYITWHLNSKV